jgi:hypothetical protein
MIITKNKRIEGWFYPPLSFFLLNCGIYSLDPVVLKPLLSLELAGLV